MELNFRQVKRIFDTLPVGFYLGSRVNMSLDEFGNNTFINRIANEIVVSYPMIEQSLSAVANVKDEDLEMLIRSMVYHEVSHAILTPVKLLEDAVISIYSAPRDEVIYIMNTMEDQRIENFLRFYFTGVNFNKAVSLINDWDNTKNDFPTDPLNYFYRVVRFGWGDEYFVNKAKAIYNKHTFNSSATYGWYYSYIEQSYALYEEIKKKFTANNGNSGNCQNDCEQMSDNGENKNDTQFQFSHTDEYFSNLGDEQIKQCAEMALNDFNNTVDVYHKKNDMIGDIENIISAFNKRCGGGSAICAYSGVINPRNVARNDYKLFDRKSQSRGSNPFTSIHLNLFLDESGSYFSNQERTNQLIAALEHCENINKNFTFDIVYCGIGERLVTDKKDREMKTKGCNYLDSDIFGIYNKLQKKNTYNYNIVLFDGYAFTGAPRGTSPKAFGNFGAFNHNNCSIISDYSNSQFIKKYAPSANATFVDDNAYFNHLKDNVISALRLAFR